MQFIHIFIQQTFRFLVSLINKFTDFFIDLGSDFFTVVFISANITSQENLVLTMTKRHRTQFRAHTVFTDHLTGQRCSTLQVIAGTAGNFFQYQSFSNTAA